MPWAVIVTEAPAAISNKPVQLVAAAQSTSAESPDSVRLLTPALVESVTTHPEAAGPGPMFETVMVHDTGSPGLAGTASSVLVMARSGWGSATIGPIHDRYSVMPLQLLVWVQLSSSPTMMSIDATFCAGSLNPMNRVDWLPQPTLSSRATEPPQTVSSGVASSGVIDAEATTAPVVSSSFTTASTPPSEVGVRVSRSPTQTPNAPTG